MKKFLFILSLIILSSCNEVEEDKLIIKTTIRSNDYSKFEDKEKLEIIKLDDVNNFYALLDKMGEIECQSKAPLIAFDYENKNYELIGYYGCPTKTYDISCYFRVNHIFIKNDSVYTNFGGRNKKETIDNLGKYLEKIMSKSYNFELNENKLKTGIVNLNIDENQPIAITKKVLSRITDEFIKIEKLHGEGYFDYQILYEKYDIKSIPPPPPPPVPNKK